MINYYNAFISYKHADLDNKVAAAIVKGLEHYHIPGKIRKQTGVKKIDRIFRDKDELPITNDLNDTIEEALKNSDYLIVICSTNTKKSTWVEKEIETFLKNHTMGQVLTVLADGEPYDVIPKVLLTAKKTVTDENGETHIVEVPLEPLSCDFRMPFKKARAEELPRLAAALIGCSYDELMNRHRQYKMRRLTAIFAGAMALMLGFAGYMFYSNTLIHKNYIESLRSKSKYLANESLKQLDKENRIEAMQLALEALPKDENDETPVTPEAQKAITHSSFAYESLHGANVCSAWNYDMSNEVLSFKVSDDGTKLAAEDAGDNVTVWDTQSHKIILDEVIESNTGFFFFDNDTLLVTSWNDLEAYDLKNGERLWSNKDIRTNEDLLMYSDNSFLVPDSLGGICEVSIKDGTIVKTFDLQILDDTISLDYADNYVLSDDKKSIIFTIGVGKNESYSYENKDFTLYEYNMETGELLSYYLGENRPSNVALMDGNIYVSCIKPGMDGSQKLYDYIYITEDHTDIYCFSSEDLSQKWQYDFVSNNVAYTSGFKKLTGNKIAFFSGNMCRIWDNESGQLELEHNLNNSIMLVHDSGVELDPTYVTRNGDTASALELHESSYGLSFNHKFTDELTDIVIKKGIYTHQDYSHTIVFYNTQVTDDQWTKFDNCPVFNAASTFNLFGDVFVIAKNADEGEGTDLMLFDASQKSYKTTIHLSDDLSYTQFNGLGTYNGKLYYIYTNREEETFTYHLILESYDLITGEREMTELNDDYGSSSVYASLSGNKLVYFNNHSYDSCVVTQRDIDTGSEKEVEIENPEIYSAKYLKYFPNTDHVFLICGMYDAPRYELIDFKAGTVVDMSIPEEFGSVTDVAIDEEGKRIAITNDESILLKSMEGDLIAEISCNNTSPLGMTFHNFKNYGNLLIVPYHNGTMFRYNGDTGEFAGKSDLTTYSNNYSYEASFEIDDENNLLYIQEGNIMNMFELDSWIETAYIINCYGHHTETDTFITYAYESSRECELGYFKHYSITDLMNKTKDYLQGNEMGEDQKSMYGIDG
jgi:hypothetical protein